MATTSRKPTGKDDPTSGVLSVAENEKRIPAVQSSTSHPGPEPGVVLLLGAPASGKGTQARLVSAALGIPHISMGELLREEQLAGTERGRVARGYMDRGDLAPDDLVVDMVLSHLSAPAAQRGAVLDGFPRTLAQAHVLDDRLAEHGGGVRSAIYLDVPSDVLATQLAGRRVHGDDLGPRSDDRPDVAPNRIQVYLRETQPVIAEYATRGLLRRVDGAGSIDEVHERVMRALGSSRDGS